MSKVKVPITFYPNTSDGTHCYQAVLKSVLDVLFPGETFTMEQLEKITHKLPGMWTWGNASFVWLNKRGVNIKIISRFDNNEFAKRGIAYFRQEYGDEIADENEKFSNIDSERFYAQQVSDLGIQEYQSATLNDIDQLIAEGYLVKCSVNSRVIDNLKGYVGHAVLIKEIDINNGFIILNNPGLPPKEDQKITLELFEKAWGYGGDKMKSLVAFAK